MGASVAEVAAATRAWADAMRGRDVERVIALYDPGAVPLDRLSPTRRDTPETVRD